MAATNYTPIQLYFSTTASAVPLAANLAQGELAINITDGKLYYEDNAGVVQVIATKGAGTIGGSTTQIQYNNAGALAGNAAMTFNSGTSTTTLTTLNLTNALGATYGGTAQSAYAQGDFLYASATNTLSKLGIGTVNYILTSTGSVPQWSAPSSIIVQTATNLAGGAGGSVPYQSAVDTTTFLAIGAANRVMTSTGSAPQWVTSLTGLTGVSSSSITNTSLTSGRVVVSSTGGLQADDADLTFDGTTLSAGGYSTVGLSTLVKTVKIGDSNFSGVAVFAAATPAKLYIGTGTVTDTTSAIGATNAVGAISSLAITPIAATNTSVTYTNAATLYIAGAPSAGTNVTLTNPYALYVAAGDAYFGGTVTAGTVNLTTLDLTNLEVTNIKAKDGTAAMSIADSTGAVTVSSAFSTQGNTTLGNATADNVTVTGTVTSNLIFTDNTYDIGASGATRPRSGFFGTSLTAGTTINAAGAIKSTGANLVNEASAIKISQETTAISRVSAYGNDASTQGSLQIRTISSDGTSSATPALFSSTGLAVTGTFSSTGGATIQGLTVGLGVGAVATNTAVGVTALGANTAGIQNTAVGYQALKLNTSNNNTAVGYNAGAAITTASTMAALGYQALAATTAERNTGLGFSAGSAITTGGYNTAVGSSAMGGSTNLITGTDNIAVGAWHDGVIEGPMSRLSTGSYNVAVGNAAMRLTTTGGSNVAVGQNALTGNITGSNCVAIGSGALVSSNTNGNTAVGDSAGYSTTGGSNVFVGSNAGFENTSGSQLTIVGFRSGRNFTTADGTIAIGYEVGFNSGAVTHTGSYNILIGGTISSVQNPPGFSLSSGANNVIIGNGAGQAVSSGSTNTFVGYRSGDLMTTGSKNSILGRFDGNSGGLDIRTASNYIVLSDGDGNPRGYFDNTGNFFVPSAASNGTLTVSGSTRGILNLRGNYVGSTDICQVIASNANNSTAGRLRWINTNGGASDTTAMWTMLTTAGIESTGTITNAYGLGLGESNPPSSGLGIAFPATQSASSNANTLDDYEEGTWTPTISTNGFSGTPALSSGTGVYTKIGRVVTVRAILAFGSFTYPSGYVLLAGLPFTTAAGGFIGAFTGAHPGSGPMGGACAAFSNSIDAAPTAATTTSTQWTYTITYFV